MANGQGYGGTGGHGAPPPPQYPYGRASYQQNPYAQPVPPPQPYPPRQPYPSPAQPQPASGPPGGFPGPAPRRSRLVVLTQFLLQWIYAPLWILGLVLLFVLLILADNVGGGSGPSSDG